MKDQSSTHSPFGIPGGARFRVIDGQPPRVRPTSEELAGGGNGEWVLQWQYAPIRNALWSVSTMVAASVVFCAVGVGMLSEFDSPMWIIGVPFASIPLLIVVVGSISLAFEKRTETLRFFPDRIEHEAVSTLVHYLVQAFEVTGRYEFANTGIQGWIGRLGFLKQGTWYGSSGMPDVDVLYRDELPKLSFYPFGETPECILVCSGKAMVIGPYLSHVEQRVVAETIRLWLVGNSPADVADAFRRGIEKWTMPRAKIEHWNRETWTQLLDDPPRRCTVDRDESSHNAVVAFRNLKLHFDETAVLVEKTHLGVFVNRQTIRYNFIHTVRHTWNSVLLIDFTSDDDHSTQSVQITGNAWIASLIAIRADIPVYWSKILSDERRPHLGGGPNQPMSV